MHACVSLLDRLQIKSSTSINGLCSSRSPLHENKFFLCSAHTDWCIPGIFLLKHVELGFLCSCKGLPLLFTSSGKRCCNIRCHRLPFTHATVGCDTFGPSPGNLHNPCQVLLSARTEDKLQAVAEEITSAGGEAVIVVGDVSKVQTLSNLDSGSICRAGCPVAFRTSCAAPYVFYTRDYNGSRHPNGGAANFGFSRLSERSAKFMRYS